MNANASRGTFLLLFLCLFASIYAAITGDLRALSVIGVLVIYIAGHATSKAIEQWKLSRGPALSREHLQTMTEKDVDDLKRLHFESGNDGIDQLSTRELIEQARSLAFHPELFDDTEQDRARELLEELANRIELLDAAHP